MDHEKIVWPPARTPEDPIGKMADDFVDFIGRQEFTADQVREAYLRLMGVSERTDADPAITTILTEMRRLESAHVPLNRFAEFIGTLQELEDVVPRYMEFVEGLPIPTTDKWKLRSIVKEQKGGVLQIDVVGQPSVRLLVKGIKNDPELMASELLHALNPITDKARAAGQSITFTFHPGS